MFDLQKVAPGIYQLPQKSGMIVPGLVIASEKMLQDLSMEKALEQVCNVAHLPGIVGYSIAMPDIHWGYGFPIGGVAAMDAEHGVISPGGVGYDINCGVRVALLEEKFSTFSKVQKERLLNRIYSLVPSGVGHGQKKETGLSESDYKKIAEHGVNWAIEKGYGFKEDLDHIESLGKLEGASVSDVSTFAKNRGKNQLGSIGSGNHFVEIGVVEEIFCAETANAWKIQEGQTYVLIHSGSRGFGHQICQDTLEKFIGLGYAKNLPDKQLVCAPIQSDAGRSYFRSMAAAANFAFNNRQIILHEVRKAFEEECGIKPSSIRLLYDVCHNIAKFEKHNVNGEMKELCVHRKGATRAYGKGSPELSSFFQATGQPVLVPGDMGRASYILAGLGNPMTFCSCCHGAGRSRSRIQSSKNWKHQDALQYMQAQGVLLKADSYRTIVEEMPDAYKDVTEVVQAVEEANLSKNVAKLKPRLVIKG